MQGFESSFYVPDPFVVFSLPAANNAGLQFFLIPVLADRFMAQKIIYGSGAEGTEGGVHPSVEVAVSKAVELAVALTPAAGAHAVSLAVAKRLAAVRAAFVGGSRHLGVYVS